MCSASTHASPFTPLKEHFLLRDIWDRILKPLVNTAVPQHPIMLAFACIYHMQKQDLYISNSLSMPSGFFLKEELHS